jgi:hypothetical protein
VKSLVYPPLAACDIAPFQQSGRCWWSAAGACKATRRFKLANLSDLNGDVPLGFLIHVNGRFRYLRFPFSKRNKPMKRLVPTAAILLATSTPAFTRNTEQENNAAVAAVIYMIAQKRCNMTTGEDGKLRGMTISVIEGNGFTWEQVVYGEKQMIGNFLKDNPVYEKATNNDRAAVKTVCNGARSMLAKKK